MGEAILRSLDVEAVAAIAAVALSRATGAVTTLRNPASIVGAERRNLVLRAVAVFPDGREKPVIAKATRAADYDCSRADAFAWSGFVKEWVATDMLTRVAPGRGHGAAFLAGDAAAGVMVLEDLGADRPSLVRPLLEGTAGEAADALTAWARALGRMHADAAAHEATSVEGLRRDFSSADPPIPDPGRFDTWWAGVADHHGGTVPEAERSAIAARLGAGGAWFSLVHGDPCPDNVLYVDGTARVIDYEFAERGHALWDAAHWRLGFPTCWCAGRVPPEVVARIELAYREELVRGTIGVPWTAHE